MTLTQGNKTLLVVLVSSENNRHLGFSSVRIHGTDEREERDVERNTPTRFWWINFCPIERKTRTQEIKRRGGKEGE